MIIQLDLPSPKSKAFELMLPEGAKFLSAACLGFSAIPRNKFDVVVQAQYAAYFSAAPDKMYTIDVRQFVFIEAEDETELSSTSATFQFCGPVHYRDARGNSVNAFLFEVLPLQAPEQTENQEQIFQHVSESLSEAMQHYIGEGIDCFVVCADLNGEANMLSIMGVHLSEDRAKSHVQHLNEGRIAQDELFSYVSSKLDLQSDGIPKMPEVIEITSVKQFEEVFGPDQSKES